MSQIYKMSSGGSVPSNVLEAINVQTGTSPVVPTANTITFNGATVAAGTHPVRTDGTGTSTMALEVQFSQAIASTNATNVGLSAFNSAQFTVDANGFVSINGSGIGETITGNTGGPLSPTAGNWNIISENTTGIFAGSGSTLTQNFIDAENSVGVGTSFPSKTIVCTANTCVGALAGNSINNSQNNTLIGYHSGLNLDITINNVGLGYQTLLSLLTPAPGSNTAIGTSSLQNLLEGTYNTALGYSSGTNYVGSESSNVLIANLGVVSENNTMRLGTSGTGAGQVSTCYIAGVTGVTVSNTELVSINSSTGQFGVVAYTPGNFLWTDVTGSTQTLAINHGYLTDNSGGVTYTLPATASIGDTIKIVGKLGLAVITPNAGQQILNGSTSGLVGVTGTASSNNVGDCIDLICITAGSSTVWRANSVVGTWTLVTS